MKKISRQLSVLNRRTPLRNPRSTRPVSTMTHYPIQDSLFGLSQEQSQLRETVFKLCQKDLAPLAQEIDRLDDFAQRQDFWKKLGQMGLLGVTADPKYGGSGLGILEHCIIGEEIARVQAGVALSVGAHSNLCINQAWQLTVFPCCFFNQDFILQQGLLSSSSRFSELCSFVDFCSSRKDIFDCNKLQTKEILQ